MKVCCTQPARPCSMPSRFIVSLTLSRNVLTSPALGGAPLLPAQLESVTQTAATRAACFIPRSLQRPDVHVRVEEVVGVVFRFELAKPRVVAAVDHGGRIAGGVMLEVVDVAERPQERLQRLVGVAAPRGVALAL